MTTAVRELLSRLSAETVELIEEELEAQSAGGGTVEPEPIPGDGFLHLADGRRIPGQYRTVVENFGTQEQARTDPYGIGSFGHVRVKVPIWNNVCSLRGLEGHQHTGECGSLKFVNERDKDYYLGRLTATQRGGIAPGTFTDILPS